MKTILPLTYWGSIEQFANLVQGGEEAIIDLGENYVKRSERNRTEIVTPTGGMVLSVPLVKANRPRTPMRDMRIDSSKRWQHQQQRMALKKEIRYYEAIRDSSLQGLKALERDRNNMERVAREKYGMHLPDEEIFIIK